MTALTWLQLGQVLLTFDVFAAGCRPSRGALRGTARRVLIAIVVVTIVTLPLVAAVSMVLKSSFSTTPFLEAPMNHRVAFSPTPESPGTSEETPANPCPGLSAPPADLVNQQQFLTIDTTNRIYLHSAFYDNTSITTPLVRLVIVKRARETLRLQCQVWFRTQDPYLVTVTSDLKWIFEDHGRLYAGAHVKCPLHGNERPYAVSIVTTTCDKPTHVLPVHYNGAILSNFTMCVTPLNLRYSRTHELVEMLELNSILGADRFVFYNYSTSPNVDEVLRHYERQGKVEVVQWHLPMKVNTWPLSGETEIHYFGQLPALNDCLYRNLGRARHLVYTDLDEFIVPRKVRDWPALLASQDILSSPLTVAIGFRCVFFRKDWPLWKEDFEDKERAIHLNATTLLTVYREKLVMLKYLRTKFIVRPEGVETMGIHRVWDFKKGGGEWVEPSAGLLHHYRNWERPSDFEEAHMLDTHMHTYKEELLDRLQQVWTSLPPAMGAAEPPPQKRK